MTTNTQINLSDLASQVDMRAFYEAHGVNVVGKPTNSRNDGKEYSGSCPRCGGEDRFKFWDSGRFNCIRGTCGQWHGSSPYWFLRDQDYSHRDALQELGIDPADIDFDGPAKVKLPLFLTQQDEPPCQVWQQMASAFCQIAEKCLWSSQGQTALDYLHQRGFTDATIKAAHLGLFPDDWYKASLESWGLSPEQLRREDDPLLKIPRGITLPYYVEGNIHKLQLRRPDGQYFEVLGSAEVLYNVDSLQPGRDALLVESEFDARSVEQEAGDLIACLATGGTPKGRTGRNIARLLVARQILQGFDSDPAGDAGAEDYWLKKFSKEKIIRWSPWGHDTNDMLTQGLPIRLWIETGLQAAQSRQEELAQPEPERAIEVQPETPAPPALSARYFDRNGKPVSPDLVERVAAFQIKPCAGCGGYDWMIDTDGLLICPCIVQRRKGEQVEPVGPLPPVQRPETDEPPPTAYEWMPRNDRGLARFCVVCRGNATWWTGKLGDGALLRVTLSQAQSVSSCQTLC